MFSGLVQKASLKSSKTRLALMALTVLLSFSPVLTSYAQGTGDYGSSDGYRNQRQERPRFRNQGQGRQGGGRQGQGRQGQNREMMQKKMMEKFGLTSEQMAEFKAIREESKAEAESIKSELKQKRQAMMQYMQSSDASESKALSMNREMSNLMARVGELRIKTLFKMKNAMTPEQYEQFVAHRKKAQERMKGRRGGQGRQGQGGFQGRRQGGQGQGGFQRRRQGGFQGDSNY